MGKPAVTGNLSKPYARTTWRGHRFDQRTVSALKWAEKHYLAVAPKKRKPFRIGQGSYANGSLSAGTHAGGGAVDIMFAGLPKKQQRAIVKWLRRAGFAAWSRVGPGWAPNNEHAHAILPSRTNSYPAKVQVTSYRTGRNGLANNAVDSEWCPKRKRRWSHKQNKPILGK